MGSNEFRRLAEKIIGPMQFESEWLASQGPLQKTEKNRTT